MATNIRNTGMNTGGVLLIIFIVLKIVGVINWSWWWVLCPLWIPIVLVVGVVLVGLVGVAIVNWKELFGTAKGGKRCK